VLILDTSPEKPYPPIARPSPCPALTRRPPCTGDRPRDQPAGSDSFGDIGFGYHSNRRDKQGFHRYRSRGELRSLLTKRGSYGGGDPSSVDGGSLGYMPRTQETFLRRLTLSSRAGTKCHFLRLSRRISRDVPKSRHVNTIRVKAAPLQKKRRGQVDRMSMTAVQAGPSPKVLDAETYQSDCASYLDP
jgi:hypothetical protein